MQWVIPLLLRAGHEVRGVDNFYRYGRIERTREYEFVEGDLSDPDTARRAVRGVDGVIQAAARIFGVGGFHRYAADILSSDVVVHQNILRASVEHAVPKVVYISSSMVFERARSHPSKEEDAFDAPVPATDYGLSKLVGERLSRAFYGQYGIRYAVWRPFNIITPYEQGEEEPGLSHVFADFIRSIVQERKNPLPIIGDGRQIRCFTWIGDVARAIADWSFHETSDGETFNLGNPEPITMRELANLIQQEAKELGLIESDAAPLEFTTMQTFADDVRKRIPDVSKARLVLGWEPIVTTRDAVRRCLKHLAQHEGVGL